MSAERLQRSVSRMLWGLMSRPEGRSRIELENRYGRFPTRALRVAGERPTFLLLHGFTDSADCWRDLLDALASRGRAAVAIDLPSHGKAASVDPTLPALAQLVDAAESAARELGPDTVVVGNSLGGTVALLLAERDVPLGGVVALGPGAFDHPLWLRLALSRPVLRALDFVPAPLLMPSYRSAALNAKMSSDAIPRYLHHLRSGRNQRRLRRLGRALAHEAVDPYDHSKISSRVGLIWGSRDRFSNPSGSRSLQEAIPSLAFLLLEGVGHTPQQEVPDQVADFLIAFADAGNVSPLKRDQCGHQ